MSTVSTNFFLKPVEAEAQVSQMSTQADVDANLFEDAESAEANQNVAQLKSEYMLSVDNYNDSSNKVSQFGSLFNQTVSDANIANSEYTRASNTVMNLGNAVNTLTEAIEANANSISLFSSQLSGMDAQISIKQNQIAALNQYQANKQLVGSNQQEVTLLASIDNINISMVGIDQQIAALEAGKASGNDTAEVDQQIAQLREARESLEIQLNEANAKLNAYRAMKAYEATNAALTEDQIKQQIEKLTQEIQELRGQKDQISSKKETMEYKIEADNATLKTLETQLANAKQTEEKAKEKYSLEMSKASAVRKPFDESTNERNANEIKMEETSNDLAQAFSYVNQISSRSKSERKSSLDLAL